FPERWAHVTNSFMKILFSGPPLMVLFFWQFAAAAQPLSGTELLIWDGDLAARMVAGIDQYLSHELEASPHARAAKWSRDFSSIDNYLRSIAPNRQRFREIIGLADPRAKVRMQFRGAVPEAGAIAQV